MMKALTQTAEMTLILLIFGFLPARAATHYLVPTNSAAVNPYTNWATAGTSVIDVVNAAMTNSSLPRTVWASNGVYVLTNSVTITNNIALRGVNGRDVTLFDGIASYDFSLQHVGSVLDGLTITNCRSASYGGIDLCRGMVTNCIITDNTNASWEIGAGIHIRDGTSTVANCVIKNNSSSSSGGGITIKGGPSTIKNNIIKNNRAVGYGGGILARYSSAIIRNCLIADNSVAGQSGGGICISATNVFVANCTIVSNYAAIYGGGIHFEIAAGAPVLTNTVINCVIVSNRAPSGGGNIYQWAGDQKYLVGYSCSTSNTIFIINDSRGNTTNAPEFTDFAGENYRFNRTSPCYNSGTNQTDWMNGAVDLDGHARILHGRADMGAYELFIPSGTVFRFR